MKLNEEIDRIKQIMGVIILEASKVDSLVSKLGLTQENAEKMERICGKLSIIMTNKLKNHVNSILENAGETNITDESITTTLNNQLNRNQFWSALTSIMDYIRVGLNGDISTLKDFTINEIYTKSREWHDSLEVGQGKINYVEESPIILDFRDENGNGFYWVNLETNYSEEECERMGHCGRTGSNNTLYSLREYKTLPGGKYTLNKSHLTASIGSDGTLYQLKGPKNSKPKEDYHDLILELFYQQDDYGDYLIQDFGSEYAGRLDFKLSDLSENTIKLLYLDRPELFNSRSLQRKLIELGIIEKPEVDYFITLEIPSDSVGDIVDGDWVIRKYKRKITTPAGNEYERTVEVTLTEAILSGDIWDLWEGYDVDWESSLHYSVDGRNKNEIETLIRRIAFESDPELLEIDFNDLTLEEKIKEYDDNYEIRSAISSATNDAEADSYYNYLYDTLKSCLEEYGDVEKMDDTGVIININVEPYLNSLDDSVFDEYMDNCDDDITCVFKEMLSDDHIDKPDFSTDDRWSPDVNEQYFNEILSDRLSEI
jgi:hypothetical protein